LILLSFYLDLDTVVWLSKHNEHLQHFVEHSYDPFLEYNPNFAESHEHIIEKTTKDCTKSMQGISLFILSMLPSLTAINPTVAAASLIVKMIFF
jgi:disulfide bond formation protein DsbB